MSTMSAVYLKQSQRISAAHFSGWPPSSREAAGVSHFSAGSATNFDVISISKEAELRNMGLSGDLARLESPYMTDLQGDLLEMMLERLGGEDMGARGFEFPTASADALEWFALRYGVPRAPRRGPQAFAADMAVLAARSQQTNFSADAVVRTADQQDVNVAVQLSAFQTSIGAVYSNHGARTHQLTDPLFASFGGTASELTQTSFRFELGVQWSGVTFTNPSGETQDGRANQRAPRASTRAIQGAFFEAVSERYSKQASPPDADNPSGEQDVRRGAADAWNAVLANGEPQSTPGPRRWVA